VIEAFFTRKERDLYAILPRWKSGEFVLKGIVLPETSRVTMLASGKEVSWQARGQDTVLQLHDHAGLAEPPTAAAHAWVLKLEGALPAEQ
jgi:alpha-L-fucosidase